MVTCKECIFLERRFCETKKKYICKCTMLKIDGVDCVVNQDNEKCDKFVQK
jgi:hypothetical protein